MLVRLGLLCLFALGASGARPQETEEVLGIQIGLTSGAANIVENDVVLADFLEKDKDGTITADFHVPETEDHFSFFVYNSKQEGVRMQKPLVSVSAGDVAIEYVTHAKHLEDVPFLADAQARSQEGASLSGAFRFDCIQKGDSMVKVTTRYIIKKQYKTITFNLLKTCGEPDDTVQGAFIAGLFIGTRSGGNNVVKNGEAQSLWEIHTSDQDHDNEVEDHVQMEYDEAEPAAVFYAMYEGKKKLKIQPPFVVVNNEDIVTVKVHEQTKVKELDNKPAMLSLQFTCLKKGTTEVTVALKFPEFPDSKVIWSFKKTCSQLAMFEGVAVPGLNVGLKEGDSDVVKDGQTTELFRNAQSQAEELDKQLYGIDANTDSIDFYIEATTAVGVRQPILTVSRSLEKDLLHVAKPVLSGSVIDATRFEPGQKYKLTLTFNCQRSALTDISIQIPIKPDGYMQWVFEKTCEVADNFIPEKGAKLKDLPGLNVGSARNGKNVVQNGQPNSKFHWETSIRDLKAINGETQFVTFFFTMDNTVLGAEDVRLGVPELISSLAIAEPEISGRASSGDVVSVDSHSSITITFHCVSDGATLFNLYIPVLPIDADSLAPRKEPIIISFVKECPLDHGVHVGVGGVGLRGLSIGLTKGGNEVAKNGFPLPVYYGQRNKGKPEWEAITVPEDVPGTRLFLALAGNEDDEVDSITFQAPLAITHGHECAPKLSGSAAWGGQLTRAGEALELDITWDCRFKGLGTATIAVPIVPHGKIIFTIPKQCSGPDRPEGVVLPGLNLGSKSGGTDLVKSGLTQEDFLPYKRHEAAKHTRVDEPFDIWIENKEGILSALEPLVFSSRNIANPYVTHTWAQVGKDGRQAYLIPTTPTKITVDYNCVNPGETPITLVIPVLPRGSQVSVTWTVMCGGEDWTSGGYMDSDFSYSYLDEESTPSSSSASDNGGSSDSDDWFSSDYYTYDEYYTQGEYYTSDFYYSDFETTDEFSWNPYVNEEELYAENQPLGWINVGSGLLTDDANDVVRKGVASSEYALSRYKGAQEGGDEDLENSVYTVVSRNKILMNFWLSVPQGYQGFFVPSVTAKPGPKGADICAPILAGPAAYGGNLTSNKPIALSLEFNCLRPGVTPVQVTIPLVPSFRGQVSFRVIKVCKNPTPTVEWYWTASRIMILGAMVVFAVVGLVAYRYLQTNKDGYAPVSLQERGGANQASQSTKLSVMDDFDVDSDSD